MADISSLGPIEQMTGQITSLLQPAFSTFPNHDAAGNIIGVQVYSFYSETPQTWPSIVCRVHPSAHRHSAIGNWSAPESGIDPGTMADPIGTLTETIMDPAAVLELRLGARSEVERERMMDWAYRALMYHGQTSLGQAISIMDQLGWMGCNVLGLAQPPVLPDIDPTAPRPQGYPPVPGQLFFTCQIEFSLSTAPLPVTVTVVPPTFTTNPAH